MAKHSLDQFQELVRQAEWEYLNDRRAKRTLDDLGWGDENVVELLCALTSRHFQKTVPNCRVEDYPGIEFVDADQYRMDWSDDLGTFWFSLKIAIVQDGEGHFAGLVTLHGS